MTAFALAESVVEQVARAICESKGLNPNTLYQHNFEGDWPEDERREYQDPFTGEPRVQLFHRAWRRWDKAARAAIAAIPRIEDDTPTVTGQGVAWINWQGGKQPVPDWTIVEFEQRNGKIYQEPACSLCWPHDGPDVSDGDSDIMRYRVIAHPTPSDGLLSELVEARESDPAIWRNAIGNTIALIDMVRKQHSVPRGSKLYATFDAALNDMMEKWFSFSRGSAPKTYEQAEDEWKRFCALAKAKAGEGGHDHT